MDRDMDTPLPPKVGKVAEAARSRSEGARRRARELGEHV